MENSLGTGFMAVFAVSGSVVLLAHQIHKRLLSDFMKKMEFELGPGIKNITIQPAKKKVRFSEQVVEVWPATALHEEDDDDWKWEKSTMPLNWQVLYKGIIEYKKLSTCH